MASLFTPLRTFLCYMDFLELSKYGAEFSFRLLSDIYIFFIISDISSFNPRKTLRLQRKLCFLFDSYFMLSAIQFCQFLFMSSLCKLSFHPEMEFSFMLKLLLSFCQLGELSCPPQSPQPNLCKITWTLELKLNCLSYCLFSIFFLSLNVFIYFCFVFSVIQTKVILKR